jgi:hypothetical protein
VGLEIVWHHQGQHLSKTLGLKLDAAAINASHLDHAVTVVRSLIDVVREVEEPDNCS